MRKRKPGYYPKIQESTGKSFDWMGTLCIVCPLLAVATATFVFASMLIVAGTSFWIAVPCALVGSIVLLAIGIISSGSDMTDVVVPSIILIVISLMLIPVFLRAKSKAQRHKKQQLSLQIVSALK